MIVSNSTIRAVFLPDATFLVACPQLSTVTADGTSGSFLRRRFGAQFRGHHYQVGERVGIHLCHHLAEARLSRDLADPELETLEAWEEARHEGELSLQQIPFYEQRQYRAFAELLGKEP